MTKPQTVQELIDRINAAWAEWTQSWKSLKLSELDTPAGEGLWSIKDIIAHITWHEQEMVNVIKARALAGSDWWELPMDERNEKIYQQYKDRDIKDVLVNMEKIHAELMEVLPALTDEDLFDSSRFADMPAEWAPWSLIANNTYEHYRAHFSH